MHKKLIFIGGIHGVGKTTLCKNLSIKTGIQHYSSSWLIQTVKADYKSTKDKRVQDIKSNQELLMKAVDQYMDDGSFYFLDGHFCLLNSDSEICSIQKETFEQIAPIGIIVLYDSIDNIYSKIINRDGTSYSKNLISSFQNSEIEHSKKIANEFSIPYMLFNINDDVCTVSQFINEYIIVAPESFRINKDKGE